MAFFENEQQLKDFIVELNTVSKSREIETYDCTGKTQLEVAKFMMTKKDCIVIHSGSMGCGKTETMKVFVDLMERDTTVTKADVKAEHYANGGNDDEWAAIDDNHILYNRLASKVRRKNERHTYCYTAHRISLISQAANRLGFTSYKDDAANIKGIKKLAVCVNSMARFESSTAFNVLLIDEIRQTFTHVLNGTAKPRKKVFDELIRAIKKADWVIGADADINGFTLDILRDYVKKDIVLIYNMPGDSDKTIHLYQTEKEIHTRIMEDLESDKKIYVASDSASQIKLIRQAIKMYLGSKYDKKSLYIYEDNKGDEDCLRFLSDPDKESKAQKYRIVAASPVISSGISLVSGHFDHVYYIGRGVVPVCDVMQQIGRVRTAKHIYMQYTKRGGMGEESISAILEGNLRKHIASEVDDIEDSDFDSIQSNIDILIAQDEVNTNQTINTRLSGIKAMAEHKGYTWKEEPDMRPWAEDTSKLSAEVKAIIAEAIMNAEKLDEPTYKRLKMLSERTEFESFEVKRHAVAEMTGLSYEEHTMDHIMDYLDGYYSKITNYEILLMDLKTMRDRDKVNRTTRNSQKMHQSTQKIFKGAIELIWSKECGDKEAWAVCDYLQKNGKEIVANRLGKYTKLKRDPTDKQGKHVRRMIDFCAKFGIEFVVNRHHRSKTYSPQFNAKVVEYAELRRLTGKKHDEDAK